jgi:hypothetical protein
MDRPSGGDVLEDFLEALETVAKIHGDRVNDHVGEDVVALVRSKLVEYKLRPFLDGVGLRAEIIGPIVSFEPPFDPLRSALGVIEVLVIGNDVDGKIGDSCGMPRRTARSGGYPVGANLYAA